MSILNLDAAVPFATFENAGLLYYYGDYREGGYKLTSSRADKIKFIYWDEARAANLGMHHDGSGVLANPAYESVTLTDLHNQTFGLGSIDLDTQWGIWGEIEVTFYGTTATGVVTHSVMLDTENGMEKVDLPDSFSAVTAVAWRTDEPSNILFDNIEVSHAPLVAADTTVTLVERSPAIALGIAPPGDIDGDDLAITVTAIPDAAMGDIELADGGAVAVGDTLSAEQLAGLIFTATAHSPGAAGSFSYEVSDGIARASQTIALDIAPSGEPPATTIGLWASATGPGAPGAGAPHDAYWTRPVRADDPRVTHTTAEIGGVTQETIALDAPWNAIKNIAVSTLAAADLTVSGFVDVKIDADDGAARSLHLEDAKRGEIVTGGGSDRVAVTYLSNEYVWSNLFVIETGDGDDEVLVQPETIAAASEIGASEPMTFNSDPQKTLVDIDTGTGDDLVSLIEASGSIATGEGADRVSVRDGDTSISTGAGDDLIEVNSTDEPTGAYVLGDIGTAWIDAGPGQDVIAIADGPRAVKVTVAFGKGDSGSDAASGDTLRYGRPADGAFAGGDLAEIAIDLEGYAEGSTAELTRLGAAPEDAEHMLLTITDAADNHVDVINLYGAAIASASELDLHWV